MNPAFISKIIILILLLLLSSFFSSAETALTMANRIKIRALADSGDKKAGILQSIYDRPGKMLTCILIGNNLVNISASSLTATIAMEIWGNVGVSIATAILTLLILLFGEILPKSRAAYVPEETALSYAPTIYAMMVILTPLIALVDNLSNALLKLAGIDTSGTNRLMTIGELRTYLDVGHEDGAIEDEEKKMITNVFDFSDHSVRDIMTPRIDLTMISSEASYTTMMDTFRDTLYTRLPVYDKDPENITGVINLKDVVFCEDKSRLKAGDIAREAYFTYEHKKTADLMEEMQKASMTMAFILDEYGSCTGMVTLEDLLEEIVGEIRDEYDEDEKELLKYNDDGSYIIEGSMKLDDINDAVGCGLHSEDYDSIGGLLMGTLDRMPEPGEYIELPDGTVIKAMTVSGSRVEKVMMVLPPPDDR